MKMGTKAQESIYDIYHKIVKRMDNIGVAYKHRSDHLVLSDLREGKAVIVARGFKTDGKDWQRGEEFTCNLIDIQRIAFIMETTGRILVTKQEHDDWQEWARLKPIAQALAPMIETAKKHASHAASARAQAAAAEAAALQLRGEAATAKAEYEKAEQEAAEYISGLKLEI